MMNSFRPGILERQTISPGLLSAVREIGEYKGREELFRQRAPQVLETLRKAAIIRSTESSNRIEGVSAPEARMRALLADQTEPRDRPEQEIAGYRDVLRTIHVNHPNMPFTTGVVRQLHRDLYRFTSVQAGRWKVASNEITETLPDGNTRVRFRPIAPHLTGDAMERLHDDFRERWERNDIDRLLLVGAYVLDFLCIHPFLDGNGRMARLLALLLLYRAGYSAGRYVSLEQIVEETRDGYYDALNRSSQKWHEGKHSLLPWWEYFFGVNLRTAYRRLEERLGAVTTRRGAKREMVLEAVRRLPKRFRYAHVMRACPGISRPTVNRALQELRDRGTIRLLTAGRKAEWEKT